MSSVRDVNAEINSPVSNRKIISPDYNIAVGMYGDGASTMGDSPPRIPSSSQAGRQPAHKGDPDATLRFLGVAMLPGDILGMCATGADITRGGLIVAGQRFLKAFFGWYNDANALTVDAGRFQGVSGYLGCNPVIPDMLACSANTLKVSKSTTKDKHIRCLRWLYLDFDPDKPDADMSATEAELAAALAKRDAVLERFPELAASSIWGCSGNGGWLLVRLPDYENDETHRSLIVRTVDHFAENFGADRKTKNPARLMPLVGTIKCKGSNVPDRPWRLVTMDSPDLPEGRTFDLAAFAADHIPDTPPSKAATATRSTTVSVPWSTASGSSQSVSGALVGIADDRKARIFRATKYLENMAPAVSGQNGHNQCFDAACVLILGFDLTVSEALSILKDWNRRCQPPWSEPELLHKLTDADARPGPRGYLHDANKPGRPIGEPAAGRTAEEPTDAPDPPCPIGFEDNPHHIAACFTRDRYTSEDGPSLRYHLGEFYDRPDGYYRPKLDGELQAEISQHANQRFEAVHLYRLATGGKEADGEGKKPPRPIPVTRSLVANIQGAVASLPGVMLPAAQYGPPPFWIDGHGKHPPDEYLPMRNAIVHIPSYLQGQPCTEKPTPRLFNLNRLGYDWQPDAPAPARWLEFLKGIWPDDQQSIDALQEWFGLQLVPVTKYQKMFAFIGPPRAGKGVISSVMRAMVGPENCCGPTLSGLAETFGMQSLIGKLSAIIDDARLSGRSDHAVITERLLSISGEGTLDVRRMHRAQWTGVLSCRITLISNELPRLNDNSNALTNRFIILKFTQSNLGHEDNTLRQQFLAELPGILLWSIEGLRRLNERGHLVQPESGREIHEEMEDMASPVGSFVRDCCLVDPDETVGKDQLFLAWRQWCERNGRKEPGELSVFARNLRSAIPGLKATRPRNSGGRTHAFQGVGLLSPARLFAPDTSDSVRSDEWDNRVAPPF